MNFLDLELNILLFNDVLIHKNSSNTFEHASES